MCAKDFQAEKCFDHAIIELDKIIELSKEIKEEKDSLKPFLARVWNDRGHIKYLQVDFYAAVNDFTEAIKLDSGFAVPFYNRGQIHYRMGRYREAIKDLTEAIKIDPTFEDAKLNLQQAIEDSKNASAE